MYEDRLPDAELSAVVQQIRTFNLVEVGTPQWLLQHGIMLRLNNQAAADILELRDEHVKEFLVIHNKVGVLVEDIICIRVWLQEIMPVILEYNSDPNASFLIYAIMFHEVVTLSLLDMTLYHSNGCNALGARVIDLIDYCCIKISHLFTEIPQDKATTSNGDDFNEVKVLLEFTCLQRDNTLKTSMRCISIMFYLMTNPTEIPMVMMRRFVDKFDLPMTLIDILDKKPWKRVTQDGAVQKFSNDEWSDVDPSHALELVKYEAQVWVFLRQVILNTDLMNDYYLTEARQQKFIKCLSMLTDVVIVQIPVLVELKETLIMLSICTTATVSKTPILIEYVPYSYDKLYKEISAYGNSFQVAQVIGSLYISPGHEAVINVCKELSNTYLGQNEVCGKLKAALYFMSDPEPEPQEEPQAVDETETFEQQMKRAKYESLKTAIEENKKKAATLAKQPCLICEKWTNLKCGRCENSYFCSPACQKAGWLAHRHTCQNL